jgi:hypothetical protein
MHVISHAAGKAWLASHDPIRTKHGDARHRQRLDQCASCV